MARAIRKDSAAERDLVEIWIYTLHRWGEAQADRNLAANEAGVAQLAAKPETGNTRDDLRRAYWSKRIEHHVVFYTFDDDALRVRRVLHEVMDPDAHL